MNKEDLDFYAEETLKFNNIDEAFDDYIYDFTLEDLVRFLTDEMKEQIVLLSPSYVKNNGKYYFNGEFQCLDENDIKEIINRKEEE